MAEQAVPPAALRIVAPRYGAAVVGGAERLARMLALSLHGAGWSVEVVTTCARDAATWRNEEAPGISDDQGVTVRRFPVRAARPPRVFAQVSRGFWRLPAGLRPERAWVAMQGPWSPALVTALAASGPEPVVPALFLPYLYHPTLLGLPGYPGPRVLMPAAHDELPLRLGLVERAIAASGAILYGTDEEREIVEAAHPVARERPSAVGNVGIVAPERVDPVAFRRRVGLGADEPYLLYGGRVAPGKGMEELFAGVGELRARSPQAPPRLVLTGEAGTVTPPSPAVLPVGRLDEASRWDALAGAAAVVVPSFHESLSLLALEAWAVGRPVLANGASPVLRGQVLRSGGGIAYRGAAELGLAAADLISDPDVAAVLGRAGQRYVAATYRWDAVHERLARLIAEASGTVPRA
ncbi:MAG TPA: glycosyltransferase family 4 protein [Candidatus Dormibacteraeota bacterium]|nr:glycosyltransferase family 4 protein [Candidatus Dormibacteraeota bacterium]